MDVAARRLPVVPLPWRTIGVLALITILAAAAVLVAVGSRQRVPPPFGPARNGPLTYSDHGDVIVRATIDAKPATLIGGDAVDYAPGFSPDGERLTFVRQIAGIEYLWTANADGSGARQVLDQPLISASGAWSPDSRSIALTTSVRGIMRLFMVHVDGSAATEIELGDIRPSDVAWRPPNGAELLFRGGDATNHQDLYLMRADGTDLRPLHRPSAMILGPDLDVSGPSWSPTGDRIAYNQVEPTTGDVDGHFRVHVVNPDGTGDVALPGPADPATQEAWPLWSPDGRSILVHRWTWKTQDGGLGWLAIQPVDGSAPARDIGPKLPGGEDTGMIKIWSPDGTAILVRANNTGSVYSIDPLAGRSDQVDLPDLPDYRRLAP